MLHQISAVAFLHGFGENFVFHITPVYKAGFKIPVGTVDFRFPKKALHPKPIPLHFKFRQSFRNILSINTVDDFFQITVSGSMEFYLSVLNKFNGNIRAGHCQMLHHICHIAALSLGLL